MDLEYVRRTRESYGRDLEKKKTETGENFEKLQGNQDEKGKRLMWDFMVDFIDRKCPLETDKLMELQFCIKKFEEN